MSNNFTFEGQATLTLPIDESSSQATIPVVDLDLVSGGSDIQFIALQGGTRTVRIGWPAISGSLVRITDAPGGQADPGTPNSIAVTPNAVYTYVLDTEGLDSGWGKTPRYVRNWEDLEGDVRFVPMHAVVESTTEEKAVARENIGVFTGTFDVRGLLSPSDTYFTLADGVFSPKAATYDTHGVVRVYTGTAGESDDGSKGSYVTTKTYVDGRIDTLLGNITQNIPSAGWGVRGIVALEAQPAPGEVFEPSIQLDVATGTITVHKTSDYAVRESGGDPVRGLVRVAGVSADTYDPATQGTWAAPVALVTDMIDKAMPDVLASETAAGTVALTDVVIHDRRSSVPGAITVADAAYDGKLCQKGITRLQNHMELIDNEDSTHDWSHEDDTVTPAAVTPNAVRQYTHDYFNEKIESGAIVPVATNTSLGIVKGSSTVRISNELGHEGEVTVPLASTVTYGLVKMIKAATEPLDADPMVPTSKKVEALLDEKLINIITDEYDKNDYTKAVPGVVVDYAIRTTVAGANSFGTVRASSDSTDNTTTLLPIRVITDKSDSRYGKIYAEYTAEEPIEVSPATYDRYGSVKLGYSDYVDPREGTTPLFPVARTEEGRLYAVADASTTIFPVASLNGTGVVRAASVQASFDAMPNAAAVTVVAEDGEHKGEMYVKEATSSGNGTVRLQASMGGWRSGSYDAAGNVYLTESLFRPVMLDNFMAGVGTPGLITGVQFDLRDSMSSYSLPISCPIGYDAAGNLVADVADIPLASASTKGVVKLADEALIVPGESTSPVRIDRDGRMYVSAPHIRAAMNLDYISNNVKGDAVADTYAIGTIQASVARSVVFGYDAAVSGDNSVSVGYNSRATGRQAVAIGASGTAYGVGCVALGYNAAASSNLSADNGWAVAVGTNASAASNGSVAVGTASTVAQGSALSVAVGYLSTAVGSNAVAAGYKALTTENSVAIGSESGQMQDTEPSDFVSVGQGSKVGALGGTALGKGTEVIGVSGTAVGHMARAEGANALAIGAGADATGAGSAAIGGVKVYTDGIMKYGMGDAMLYFIAKDPNTLQYEPMLAYAKSSDDGETFSGKAVKLADLFSVLQEAGCTLYNLSDTDGVVSVAPPNQ